MPVTTEYPMCSDCCGGCAGDPGATLYADVGYATPETFTLGQSGDQWSGGGTEGCIGQLTVVCGDSGWELHLVDQLGFCPTEVIAPDSVVASPFELVFTFTPPACFACNDSPIPITVTE